MIVSTVISYGTEMTFVFISSPSFILDNIYPHNIILIHIGLCSILQEPPD
jgi:hypothetical protein